MGHPANASRGRGPNPRRSGRTVARAKLASGLVSLALVVALGAAMAYVARRGHDARAAEGDGAAASSAPAGTASSVPTPRAGADATAPTGGAAGLGGASGTPAGKSATVRLVIRTVPPKRAFVFWGKKRLGVIDRKAPLILQRPRDSGPMDLLVRADDCVPVYTRAYTFDDNTLAVKVTPLDQKQTIYGYKAELPPDDGAAPDPAAPDGAAAAPARGAGGAGGPSPGLFTR